MYRIGPILYLRISTLIMETVLEIFKLTIPALTVFAVVYYMLRQYFEFERFKRISETKSANGAQSLPIKLQSYERLALFLERIRLQNLVMRFSTKDFTPELWIKTLMISVHQEFEHNMVQQIYVSDKLWEIILFAKNEVLYALDSSINENTKNLEISQFSKILLDQKNETAEVGIQTALNAIKKEIQLIL